MRRPAAARSLRTRCPRSRCTDSPVRSAGRLGALLGGALLALSLTAAASLAPTAEPASGTLTGLAVEGGDRAVVRLPVAGAGADLAARVRPYSNAGYRLEVSEAGGATAEGKAERRAIVTVDLAPMGSEASFQPQAAPAAGGGDAKTDEAGDVVALARRITEKSTTRYAAVSSILGWMVRNVVTEETAALVPRPAGLATEGTGAPRGAVEEPAGVAEAGAVGETARGATATGRGGEGKRAGEAAPTTGVGEGSKSPRPDGAAAGGPGAGGAPAAANPATTGGIAPGDRAGSPAGAERGSGGARPGEGRTGSGPATPAEGAAGADEAVLAGDPASVLARGSGDAAAIARLAVALLRAVDVEARTVTGQVVGTPVVGGPWGEHTWIEVRYPKLGWVFSDPLYHHHYVPATYLRLAPSETATAGDGAAAGDGRSAASGARPPVGAAAVGKSPTAAEERAAAASGAAPAGAGETASAPPSGTVRPELRPGAEGATGAVAAGATGAPTRSTFRLVERADRRLTVDLYPAGGPGVTARRNLAVQRAGALRVVVSGPHRGSAVLQGETGRVSKVLVDGESVFVGLAGGSYRLEVYLEDRPPIVRRVQMGPRQRRAVFVREEVGSDGEAREGEADAAPAKPPPDRPTPPRRPPRRSRS